MPSIFRPAGRPAGRPNFCHLHGGGVERLVHEELHPVGGVEEVAVVEQLPRQNRDAGHGRVSAGRAGAGRVNACRAQRLPGQ